MKYRLGVFLAAGIFLAAPAQAATTAIFTFTGGMQSWIAPMTGDFTVTATGAQGASGDQSFVGGRGAQVSGTLSLILGETYQILVGGMGLGQSSGSNGGGGGGTFFVSSTDAPLLIAGGGGGTRFNVGQNGTDASVTTAAYDASGSASIYTPTLKAGGIGQGGIVSRSSWGSAGGGFFSDGATDGSAWGGGGGKSWANGMLGGVGPGGCGFLAIGGFGGGGSGNGCWGGGGGGGYSGGDGGRIAGGGGSFIIGSAINVDLFSGVGYGNGLLTIEYGQVAVVPVPAALPLFGTGLAILGFAGWRRKRRSAAA